LFSTNPLSGSRASLSHTSAKFSSCFFSCGSVIAATILLSKLPATAQSLGIDPRSSPKRAGGRVVLNNVSEQIRECYRRTEDCARKAAAQTDPTLKADFLDLERRWLVLARSYDFTERLNSFTKNSAKPNSKFNGKFNV
jgi:hypothetical protein